MIVTICFWLLAFGAAVAGSGETPSGDSEDVATLAGGFIGLSLLLAPLAFVLGASISRRQDWPLGVAAAMALAACVGLPLLIFGNPAASLLAGFAAGAVVSVSRPSGLDWRYRAVAAGVVSVVAIAGLGTTATFVPVAIAGPALPFTAVGLSDMIQTKHRAITVE